MRKAAVEGLVLTIRGLLVAVRGCRWLALRIVGPAPAPTATVHAENGRAHITYEHTSRRP